MSILIHESMSISSRNYHSVRHVFDVSKHLTDPVAILAALFHDCIYYHVDGGLSPIQAARLQGAIKPEKLCDVGEQDARDCDVETKYGEHDTRPCDVDLTLCMVKDVFGFSEDGIISPLEGLNEFLSAVIAVRELEPMLPKAVLAQIACCIEATIPFRPITPDTPMERLYQRMTQVNTKFQLDMADDELVKAVQRAALVANEDLANFGSDDPCWFLDSTWSLLPESNEALRQQYLYSVYEFQLAVYKMHGFFGFIKPDIIFSSFRNVPDQDSMEERLRNARHNIDLGRKYVAAKLLSTSLLAAFAELTGGDAPISLFTGDLPSRHRISRRLEDELPPPLHLEFCDYEVYELLSKGRRSETSFDIKQSPLAAFLYSALGNEGLMDVLSRVKVHPMTAESAELLLQSLPPEALQPVAENMAKVTLSRSEAILAIARRLGNE